MVIITINGKKKERKFQNMAQALAFAYQNGECYGAERIELAYAAEKPEQKQTEETTSGSAAVDNTDQAV